MSFYDRMQPPHLPGANPWSTSINGCQQVSEQPPCTQDASFQSAFCVTPPRVLGAEHWASLNNWTAHQKKIRVLDSKRHLADQLHRMIEVEDFKTAVLDQMHRAEDKLTWKQEWAAELNEILNSPAKAEFEDEFPLDARHKELMGTGLHSLSPADFASSSYPANAFPSESAQGDVGNQVSPIEQPELEDYYRAHNMMPSVSGLMPKASEFLHSNGINVHDKDWPGKFPAVQKEQTEVPAHTRFMFASEITKASLAEKADGLAAYVADLKSQMHEKINSGDFTLDASTAHQYEEYSRTPGFLRARRGSSSEQPLQDQVKKMLDNPVRREDTRTPNLLSNSQNLSQNAFNSHECLPEDEPLLRSPDGPGPPLHAPKPASPRSPILPPPSDSSGSSEESYTYHGYGVDSAGALHWQLPDWLWKQKGQQGRVVNGISYDFNYPPRGWTCTPEFVEVYNAREPGYHTPAEYDGEVATRDDKFHEDNSMPVRLYVSEYATGCTPRYFMDSQLPTGSKEIDNSTGE
ncbi:hypothetical protein L873DRAFT_1195007 [Choiromyces venosus 120613-1]|uniref:Uncharacterized protein n=1 Tax=Choiromyces venosus 120613-1 TaxID=1336337 RepID=A0A3N4JK38_9PEZI|nr:hypothetical protein L873DRAFT_1195007 [Choiromyces venosus 120613-1]